MTHRTPIRVLVVDDHTVVREGLCALIASRPNMQVVGQASDGDEAVTLALSLHPDVVLMDLVMPRKSGVDAIRAIKAGDPDARVLVLTSFAEDRLAYQAIKAGAQGYLLKDSSSANVLQAIEDVVEGELSLAPSIALKVIRELGRPAGPPRVEDPLTARELEVLKLVAQGLSNLEIASRLHIGGRTVTTHVSNILGKLQLANRTQAALYAVEEGLADSRPGVSPT